MADYSNQKWYKTGWGALMVIIVIIILALVVWAVLTFFKIISLSPKSAAIIEAQNAVTAQILDQNLASQLQQKSATRQLAEKTDRPSFGNKEAKLVIVEFADFYCPLCAQEFPVIREIMSKYQNDLLFIFRQFPVINENSLILAEASLCANEQDKFWAMHDRLYLNQDLEYSTSSLSLIAKSAGLDLQKFDSCIKSEKQKGTALADSKDAITLGVEGTPTFFINGNKLGGVVSKEQWESIIAKALELLK